MGIVFLSSHYYKQWVQNNYALLFGEGADKAYYCLAVIKQVMSHTTVKSNSNPTKLNLHLT